MSVISPFFSLYSKLKSVLDTLLNLSFSPITGGQGNIEFLGHFLNGPKEDVAHIDIDEVIEMAHTTFGK